MMTASCTLQSKSVVSLPLPPMAPVLLDIKDRITFVFPLEALP